MHRGQGVDRVEALENAERPGEVDLLRFTRARDPVEADDKIDLPLCVAGIGSGELFADREGLMVRGERLLAPSGAD